MPKTTKTTVTRNSEGQYQVTIPKALAEYHELEGKKLEWRQGSAKDKMEVIIVNDE
ncbi:hypothetical protein [Natrarchaeobaculum sulfurireducens]|uniref:AbrB family transcriptional regulator n=1 Tax=Natrarchaeobaculum sulfurireducens TaxID=2044521 RepID=A0A346PMF1_9EURY|nr:hypothetical protein [Natrarchaeobaculum sulfurireducens]AXR80696.1 hypothetical protein AArcMg_0674 [Natrarchaeobaculum sulfurireducens]